MSGWPSRPAIYEIGTWPWLTGLSRRYDRPVTLGDVPGEVWDELARELDPQAPGGRSRLSEQTAALHREPRRAARRHRPAG